MTAETSNARGEWVDLLERAVPFLLDEGAKYDDDGSNEPLELAREIETLLASLSSDESALSPASLAFDGGRESTPCPHTRDTNCDCAAPPPADAEPKTLPVPTRVYLTDKAAVIVGDPQRGWDEEGPEAHNCDALGCSSIGPHVLARVPFTDERALSQPAEARVYQCPRCATSMEVDPTAKPEARGVVDEGSRIVTNQLLHWGGIPVRVTGTVTTSPGNWPLIDAALTEARNVR